MKINLYTKSTLTIIAICLITLIFKNNGVIPTLRAASTTLKQLKMEALTFVSPVLITQY